jgi:glutaredoxin
MAIGIALIFRGAPVQEVAGDGFAMHYFYLPTCPHCAEQKVFNGKLQAEFPGLRIISHDVSNPEEAARLREFLQNAGRPAERLSVPATFVNGQSFMGFNSEIGDGILAAVGQCVGGECVAQPPEPEKTLKLPFIGEIRIADYSLFALAVLLGLIDGFNPCAMWVLVFLIGIVLGMRDRRRIWLIVGSFVLASAILYFLFMTAWLNVFLLIGFYRPITILVGMVALWASASDLQEFIMTKGALVCKVSGAGTRQKMLARAKSIVESPLTWATLAGIVALAFMVNLIEFVCSSVIPVVFTQTLALHQLPAWVYYGYILLYDFFFMLDDLIIFSLAAFAVTHIGDRYAGWCKLIGGILLGVLGLILLFAPHLLR